MQTASKLINENMEKYELDAAAKLAYEFFRGDFCDWYVEIAKTRVYGQEGSDKVVAQWVLRHILDKGLKMLHPFMPFITEEIWQKLQTGEETIMLLEIFVEKQMFPHLRKLKLFSRQLMKMQEIFYKIMPKYWINWQMLKNMNLMWKFQNL